MSLSQPIVLTNHEEILSSLPSIDMVLRSCHFQALLNDAKAEDALTLVSSGKTTGSGGDIFLPINCSQVYCKTDTIANAIQALTFLPTLTPRLKEIVQQLYTIIKDSGGISNATLNEATNIFGNTTAHIAVHVYSDVVFELLLKEPNGRVDWNMISDYKSPRSLCASPLLFSLYTPRTLSGQAQNVLHLNDDPILFTTAEEKSPDKIDDMYDKRAAQLVSLTTDSKALNCVSFTTGWSPLTLAIYGRRVKALQALLQRILELDLYPEWSIATLPNPTIADQQRPIVSVAEALRLSKTDALPSTTSRASIVEALLNSALVWMQEYNKHCVITYGTFLIKNGIPKQLNEMIASYFPSYDSWTISPYHVTIR